MTAAGILLCVCALLCVLHHSSFALQDLDVEEPYLYYVESFPHYDTNLDKFDLQEPFPNGACSVERKGCVMAENVIQIIPGVTTTEECRIRCQNEPDCAFLTQFSADNFPFAETCVMFSSCDDMFPCVDGSCRTEDQTCAPCSGNAHGKIGANFIQFNSSMPGEFECMGECVNHEDCTWYTYYSKDDEIYPGGCFLLSGILEPIQKCSTCQTGPKDCSERCTFSVDGGEFKNTTDPIIGNATVKARTFGPCELTVVAVGGGAQGFTGGGGSGYVEWKNISGAGMIEFDVMVGHSDEDTVLFYDDTIFLEAKSGEQPPVDNREAGGNGYSGGGAAVFMSSDGGGDGGTGGSDGEDSSNGNNGGKGSGLDLAGIPIDGFQLSAGEGGKDSGGVGGGGGGVLVDGNAPNNNDGRNGEGYGAGGYGNGRLGTPGVVLFSYHN